MYETSLLKFYEGFIKILVSKKSIGTIQCICTLLETLPHFNFRERLVDIAVDAICEVPDTVIPAIHNVLVSNELELRFYLVKAIEKFVKSSSYKVIPCEIIEILSDINFTMLQPEDLPRKRKRDVDDEDKQKSQEISMVRSK